MNRTYLLTVAFLFVLAWPAFAWLGYAGSVAGCLYDAVGDQSYIALCDDRRFGDFEHEAFYYGLGETASRVASADVVFLGDSHMQVAFSHHNVRDYFRAKGARFMLMGFGYAERWRFAYEVVKRLAPRPKIAVINADPFFSPDLSEPARFIFDHPIQAFLDAHFKYLVQRPYAALCSWIDQPCGRARIVTRAVDTGQWATPGFDTMHTAGKFPVVPQEIADDQVRRWYAYGGGAADQMAAALSAKCLVMTNVPFDGPRRVFVDMLGERLGAYRVVPEVAGLRTGDHHHLDLDSAVSWSNAFLAEFDPIGRQCGAW